MRDIADASISAYTVIARLCTFPIAHEPAQGDETWVAPECRLEAETVNIRIDFDIYSLQSSPQRGGCPLRRSRGSRR
jgi:hypothetical protein